MPKGALILPSFYEVISELPDADRLAMYDAICKYDLEGKAPRFSGELKRLWALMLPTINSSNRRYSASCENGKKGGAPTGNQNAKKKQPDKQPDKQPKNNHDYDYDSDYDYESDSDYDSDSQKKADKPQKKVFVPPTVEEVTAFVSEQGYSVDPVAFVSWYESNGWKVGRNTMKNWKAAVVTWERKNAGSSAKPYNYDYEGEGSI